VGLGRIAAASGIDWMSTNLASGEVLTSLAGHYPPAKRVGPPVGGMGMALESCLNLHAGVVCAAPGSLGGLRLLGVYRPLGFVLGLWGLSWASGGCPGP
jgi:hypothetical protein